MTQRQLAYKAKLIIFRCCAQDTAKLTVSEIARQLGVSQANLSRAVST